MREKCEFVDYKYSFQGEEYLRGHYAPQLLLYKKAVARIMNVDASAIRCTIVNIARGFEVEME